MYYIFLNQPNEQLLKLSLCFRLLWSAFSHTFWLFFIFFWRKEGINQCVKSVYFEVVHIVKRRFVELFVCFQQNSNYAFHASFGDFLKLGVGSRSIIDFWHLFKNSMSLKVVESLHLSVSGRFRSVLFWPRWFFLCEILVMNSSWM